MAPTLQDQHFREAADDILRSRRHRDKALLIGLEYNLERRPDVPPLSGIHDDMLQFRDYLIDHELYLPENITVLLDDGVGEIRGSRRSSEKNLELYNLHKPTRKTILREFRDLVEGIREGDRRILVFAGHGAQLINLDGTEADKRDEGILAAANGGFPPTSPEGSPLLDTPEDISRLSTDHEYYEVLKGLVIDNEFRKELVDVLPQGSQLVAIFETCHSGTLLDLDCPKKPVVRISDEVHGCGNPLEGASRALGLNEMRRFIRKQVRRMTVAVVAPVVAVHKTLPPLPLKRLTWKPIRRDSGVETSASPGAAKRTKARQGTWAGPDHTLGAQQLGRNPELARVICFSSSQDSQKTMAGGKCQSMVRIMIDHLKSEPATSRTKSANDITTAVCRTMYEQRYEVVKSDPKGARCDIRRLMAVFQKKQKPEVSTLKVEMWGRSADGKPTADEDTTLGEVLEL